MSISPASRLSDLAQGTAPWLWNSVVKVVLDQPVFAVRGILGILADAAVPPRKPLIGFLRNDPAVAAFMHNVPA